MPEPIVSVADLPANIGIISLTLSVQTCRHCGEIVPVTASRWDFSSRTGKAFPCPACTQDMHAGVAPATKTLDTTELAILDLLKAGKLSGAEIEKGLAAKKIIISLRQLENILAPNGKMRQAGMIDADHKGYFIPAQP